MKWIKAGPGGDAAKLVRTERDKAKAEQRDLVVYVGSTSCAPCERFHAAVARGAFDDEFPALTLIEFDLINDYYRITEAGYPTMATPFFVLPDIDGRGTGRKFEGYADNTSLSERLHALTAK